MGSSVLVFSSTSSIGVEHWFALEGSVWQIIGLLWRCLMLAAAWVNIAPAIIAPWLLVITSTIRVAIQIPLVACGANVCRVVSLFASTKINLGCAGLVVDANTPAIVLTPHVHWKGFHAVPSDGCASALLLLVIPRTLLVTIASLLCGLVHACLFVMFFSVSILATTSAV
jgi:hypothetical protein